MYECTNEDHAEDRFPRDNHYTVRTGERANNLSEDTEIVTSPCKRMTDMVTYVGERMVHGLLLFKQDCITVFLSSRHVGTSLVPQFSCHAYFWLDIFPCHVF